MPWREATLRGQKVLARVKDDGTFDQKDGRVEIRYRATDPRAYHARAGNLVAGDGAVLDESAVVPAGAASPVAKKTAKKTHHVELSADYKDSWIAYTDGACTGNPGPAGSGTIVIAPGGKIHESYAYLGQGTNNIAELTAVLEALERTPAGEALVLHTDSQYAIGVLTNNHPHPEGRCPDTTFHRTSTPSSTGCGYRNGCEPRRKPSTVCCGSMFRGSRSK